MHIKVKVYPDAKEELVKEVGKDEFQIYIREPPKEGQANKRVLRILQTHFPNRRIRLVSGHLSPSKVFEISD